MSVSVVSSSSLQAFQKDLVDALTELGFWAARAAYKDARFGGKTYKDRTRNLMSSYGSAVYVNGNLIENSIKRVNAPVYRVDKRAPAGYETGGKALETYFKTAFVVRKKDSYTILVAAAMWYASMVEKKGFKVIELEAAQKHIIRNFDRIVGPVLEKYGLGSFLPTLRKGIGVDVEHFRFGGSRRQ